VLALLMPIGPALVMMLRLLLPGFTAEDATRSAAAVAQSPGRESAVLWLGYLAILTLVPGVIAAGSLARRGAPRLATWAVALLVPAYLSMGALITGDAVLWSGHRAGLSAETTGAVYDDLHPSIGVAVGVFVVGHVVGTVLLGLALLRSRAIRAPFAWALTISQPLHFVAFVVLGVQVLDVVAWALTTVGMAAAGVALVRGRRAQPAVAAEAEPGSTSPLS